MNYRTLFTSESVSEGHPDKICDQISDAILDACLAIDPKARVAAECYASEQRLIIGGEISLSNGLAHPDYEKIARQVIRQIGYDDPIYRFSADEVTIDLLIKEQSAEIKGAVDSSIDDPLEKGAGDQGIMFGYASDEDRNFMPLAIVIAHKLVRFASNMRKQGLFADARPDMKSQVTIDYSNPKKPRVDTVVMSIQHDPMINLDEFRQFVLNNIIIPVIESFKLNTDFNLFINSSKSFCDGGPATDVGLTGRKIIVDTYGGAARHGGGAFSGKDATKVDRSGAYMARYIAKNLVNAGFAHRLEVQLSYGIGISKPLSIAIFTYKSRHPQVTDHDILAIIDQYFDCTPSAIIAQFSLDRPTFKYQDLAAYGHIGRTDLDLPWERLDKQAILKEALENILKKIK